MPEEPNDRPRLIEVAFPLQQASLDSVHEKNVRQGHISTLHIWPARRPLAACRAALIATLLPDPGDPEERKRLVERIGGRVVHREKKTKKPATSAKKKKQKSTADEIRLETEGGLLHWGRESSPDLAWFRDEIRRAFGGRAPRVLDPFAGGGAIPLEAMRLGCATTAIDINPVAWFVLRCTLEYPNRLAGQMRPLPSFVTKWPEFEKKFRKATKTRGKEGRGKASAAQQSLLPLPDADLAWHVRAWGRWVCESAKEKIAHLYPVVDGKPVVAYLWTRTVTCKNCRATVPLLKTLWLCKKEGKRVALRMAVNTTSTGVDFSIDADVAIVGANEAQRRDHDARVGHGTMSKAGATCPCCPSSIMTMEDLRLEGQAGKLGRLVFAVVVDGPDGKEYRTPTNAEVRSVKEASKMLGSAFAELALGVPVEETPGTAGTKNDSCSLRRYGIYHWNEVFVDRQLVALGTFAQETRSARQALLEAGYPVDWCEAITAYLCAMFDRLANQASSISRWNKKGENIEGTFARFALPMVWDFAEVNAVGDTSGGYPSAIEWVGLVVSHFLEATRGQPAPEVRRHSATVPGAQGVDVILTDPPYYDAIPYSNLMDFFYVWLRRTLTGLSPDYDEALATELAPKWDHERGDGELIDDPMRFNKDREKSKHAYEDGMYRAFCAAFEALNPDGRLVIVFAHKNPDAWESLVSAIIRAGFVVDGSWPIQTERVARTRSFGSAALASSVWLVCKKRPEAARPGWDNRVLDDMRERIHVRLRDFWDAGIRGPDFVWAATGPAMEAYSKHPVVKKANEPGQVLGVSEFLRHVRRLVVDFVVGRVLTREGAGTIAGLDDVTTYYLLHRNDFGFNEAPAGACILYAVSCGLTDRELSDVFDLVKRTGDTDTSDDEEDDEDEDEDAEAGAEGSGSRMRLKSWDQRKRKSLGYDAEGRLAPLIDQVHRMLHLWRNGDATKVEEYIDARVLRRNQLFLRLLQALIELAPMGSEERALLESISNHVAARGTPIEKRQTVLPLESGGM